MRSSLPGIATLKPAVNGRGRTLTFGRRPAYLLFYLSSRWDVSDMEFGLSDGYAMPITDILKPACNFLAAVKQTDSPQPNIFGRHQPGSPKTLPWAHHLFCTRQY